MGRKSPNKQKNIKKKYPIYFIYYRIDSVNNFVHREMNLKTEWHTLRKPKESMLIIRSRIDLDVKLFNRIFIVNRSVFYVKNELVEINSVNFS